VSKASDWTEARRVADTQKPLPFKADGEVAAFVDDWGDFAWHVKVPALTPPQALDLAHWILDTFSEVPTNPPDRSAPGEGT
jgi:hypothetical protein